MTVIALPPAVKNYTKRQVLRLLTANAGLSNRASLGLRALGCEAQGLKLAMRTGHIPAVVDVRPRGPYGKCRFKMSTQAGKDQIARALWFQGWEGFEYPLPAVFAALCAAAGEGLVLDVGANTGFYSLIATAVNERVDVDAFEPFPPVQALLTQNLRLNSQSRVRVFSQAVSDTMDTATLYVPLADHGMVETSCSLNREFKASHSAAVPVAQVTIDEHLKRHPAKRVSVLKIDVEGFEDRVLSGAAATLARHRPRLVLEVLPSMDQDRLDQLRRQLRYTSYKFLAGRVVRESQVRFDGASWNHLWLPEEAAFPAELAAFAPSP